MFVQKTFKNDLPTFFLVGTPIGNLADFSFRAVETLKSVDLILCEDTRTSSVLLNKYEIKKPLVSLHKFNETQRVEEISSYLEKGMNLALISDAGIPMISDPGAQITNQLRWEKKIEFNLCAVNCGSAYLHALCNSAFVNKTNYFHGFIEHKSMQVKENELKEVIAKYQDCLLSFYESPHRIKATVATLLKICSPDLKVCLNRELTKINEEIIYGTLQEVFAFLESEAFIEKGEFVLVIENIKQEKYFDEEELYQLILQEKDKGLKIKEVTSKIAEEFGVTRNYLYEIYLKMKQK